ncbi:glycosyltransferase family 4 protein [Sphingomonas oligophenolica]|uniref:Glycosyltransferase n=1 Tax=Sphingomonas oligophenolica TaxID=301154 RepID=A0ABU9Y5T7_9SPHN
MVSPHSAAANIMAYAQTLNGGGVERTLLRLAQSWSEMGRRVTLLIGDASGPLAAELPSDVDLRVLGDPSLGAMLALAGHVRELSPDVVFCPGNHYTGVAAFMRMRLGRHCPPIVAKVSNRLARTDQPFGIAQGYRAWLKLHPGFCDHVVAMSPAMRDEAIRTMGIAPGRVSVIPNPPVRRLAATAPTWLPSGRFLLGVGRLAQQKRWDRMIDALPWLAQRDTELVILGEGDARPALEAQVAALGLGGRVHLPGYDPDPRPAFARAAAVVLTSDFEGVPGVLREALAEGAPVVATDSSVAVREIVSSPAHGSIVPAGNAQALVNALDHWLAPNRLRPMPVPEPGIDAALHYLDLFDSVVAERRRG